MRKTNNTVSVVYIVTTVWPGFTEPQAEICYTEQEAMTLIKERVATYNVENKAKFSTKGYDEPLLLCADFHNHATENDSGLAIACELHRIDIDRLTI